MSVAVATLPLVPAPIAEWRPPVAAPTMIDALRPLPTGVTAPAALTSANPQAADRWRLSAWAFVRPAGSATPLGQGLLGGSQIGARAAWRFDRQGRAEVYAHLVSSGRLDDGAEGALGVSVQPLRAVPVRLSVERREQIIGSGGRSAMAAYVSGGVSDMPMPLRLRLDGYGAAGVVGLQQRDLFAEGAIALHRSIARIGPVQVDAGIGAWGTVQPDLARIDMGPSVSARWRAGPLLPRLSLDWRQRVAGDATPQSGLAVTLATDF